MDVVEKISRIKFPYSEAAEVANVYRDEANQVILHAAKDTYDYLQIILHMYRDLKQERDILYEENRILKENL